MTVTVSAIVPAYNNVRTLRACLDALYAQTRSLTEVIVIDDASTDATRAIADEYPCRVIALPVNRGPAAARNQGIRKAVGEIIFFCDADVAPEPDAVASAVALLESDSRLGCVHGFYSAEPLIDDGPIEAYRLLHQRYWRGKAAGRVPSVYFAIAAVRRQVFDHIGLLDESLRASEDDEFADRMHGVYEIELTPTVCGRHDDDDRLGAMLWKQYRRSQWIIPVTRVEKGPGGLRANRPAGILASGLTVATLPAPILWAPLAMLPVAAFCLFIAADPGLARFVYRERGLRFTGFFFVVHFLIQIAILTGALTGGVRQVLDRGFGPTRTVAGSSSSEP